MIAFFTAQNKPNKSKNSLQNYFDHLDSVLYKAITQFDSICACVSPAQAKEALHQFIDLMFTSHIQIFDPLRDRYDYFDEVLGACLANVAANLFFQALYWAMLAEMMFTLAKIIAFRLGYISEWEGKEPAWHLLLLGSTVMALEIIYLKSMLSLITRPIATLINGWQDQDIPRFNDHTSIQGRISSGLSSFVESMGVSLDRPECRTF